jgi:Beta-lactamase superfamily domain
LKKYRGATLVTPLVAILAVVAMGGCAGPRVGPGVSGVVDRSGGADTLQFTYMGTGGWLVRYGDAALLTAPLFTHPGFVLTGVAPIASDTVLVDEQIAKYDVRDVRAILVGHGHYDHLMDLPRVASRHAPDARIVGNLTVKNLLGTWSGLSDRVDLVEPFKGDQKTVGHWMEYGSDLRIMPLLSTHAPHFDGFTLYKGTADYPRTSPPATAADWLDGNTVAFLIDFLDANGETAFRIYYQDAVVAPPYGFAPEALIEQHPVDVAIFVPATFDQVDWHPEAFVENLRPKRILLGHWEDFFTPVGSVTRSIMLSDITYFEARLDRVFDGEWWRPEIGTDFRFGR